MRPYTRASEHCGEPPPRKKTRGHRGGSRKLGHRRLQGCVAKSGRESSQYQSASRSSNDRPAMAPRVTVTQLKCAVLDPEWRRRWLAGEQPSTFVYSNIGNGQVFGKRFHQET